MDDAKPAWASKTMWVSAIAALAPVICPPIGVWIAANPELFSGIVGGVFAGLRMLTGERVKVI